MGTPWLNSPCRPSQRLEGLHLATTAPAASACLAPAPRRCPPGLDRCRAHGMVQLDGLRMDKHCPSFVRSMQNRYMDKHTAIKASLRLAIFTAALMLAINVPKAAQAQCTASTRDSSSKCTVEDKTVSGNGNEARGVKYLPLWLKWCVEVDTVNGGMPWFTIKANDTEAMELDWQYKLKQREIIKAGNIIGWSSTNKISTETNSDASSGLATAAIGALFFPPAILLAPLGNTVRSQEVNRIYMKIVYLASSLEVKELLFVPTEPVKMIAYLESSTGLVANTVADKSTLMRLLTNPYEINRDRLRQDLQPYVIKNSLKPWCDSIKTDMNNLDLVDFRKRLTTLNKLGEFIGKKTVDLAEAAGLGDERDLAWETYQKRYPYANKLSPKQIKSIKECDHIMVPVGSGKKASVLISPPPSVTVQGILSYSGKVY